MIVQVGDNIISSLGFTTGENYRAVESGHSGLRSYDSRMGLQEPFVASFIDKERLNDSFAAIDRHPENYTPLEKAAILSAGSASKEAGIQLADPRVLFILSSTKGNVYLLDEDETGFSRDYLYLWHTAQKIAGYFHNPNTPAIVSNACISGAAAQIAAMRELESGRYDYAVVTGVDMLSKFIVSGFQSLKALSPEVCRPFDSTRAGLNLGEAAATLIYKKKEEADKQDMVLLQGAIRNDANHISGPSRTGEGSFLALKVITEGLNPDDLAFINAHGTATSYNDRMEAIAITRAGLHTVFVNSLKGYFGHTLGAAGVLESIISSHALRNKTILASCGFKNQENEYPLNIAGQKMHTEKTCCVKMLSGFGGCNAVLLFQSL